MRHRRFILAGLYFGVFLLVAFGIVCILFSDQIVTLIADRNLESFAAETPTTTSVTTIFQSIVADLIARLRIVGLLLVGLGGAILVGRRPIASAVEGLAASFPRLVKTLIGQLTAWLRTEDRLHLALLVGILVLAVVLRLVFLFQPMRYDEAYTYNNFASVPLYIGLANYALPNNHLLHTLLVHLTTRFGSADWLIRLPALLAGIMIVPATYALARRLHNKHTALLAAGLVACSSTLIEYSTNARGYSLLTLFFLLDLRLALTLIRSRDLAPWSLFVVFSVLGFFTIPTMLYGYGAIFVWLAAAMGLSLEGPERRMQLRRLVMASILVGILSAILYFPAYAVWGIEAIVGNKFVAPLAWPEFVSGLPEMLSLTWATWNRDIGGLLSLVLAGGFGLGLVASRRTDRYPASLLVPVTLLVCAAILIAQRVIPFSRVWLFLFPLYALFAAWGISAGLAYLARRRTPLVSAGVTALVCLILSASVLSSRSVNYTIETGTLRDAKPITAFLSNYLLEDDRVYAIAPSDAPLVYYFRQSHLPSGWIAKTVETLSAGSRIVIVVNKTEKDTLEDMLGLLDEMGLALADYSDPELVQTYETADLYLITRR